MCSKLYYYNSYYIIIIKNLNQQVFLIYHEPLTMNLRIIDKLKIRNPASLQNLLQLWSNLSHI